MINGKIYVLKDKAGFDAEHSGNTVFSEFLTHPFKACMDDGDLESVVFLDPVVQEEFDLAWENVTYYIVAGSNEFKFFEEYKLEPKLNDTSFANVFVKHGIVTISVNGEGHSFASNEELTDFIKKFNNKINFTKEVNKVRESYMDNVDALKAKYGIE